jgi:hypothetical protein
MPAPNFAPSDDLFASREGVPPFMEGMTTYAVDPARGASLLMGMYRDLAEPHRSWHNLAAILPDGRVGIVLDYPGLATGTTISSGSLHYTQLEPFTRWRYSYEGTALYSCQEGTLDPATNAPTPGRLAYEIEIACVMPPWSPPGSVFAEPVGAETGVNLFGFFVQNHRFSGWVEDDAGTRTPLDGTGWRHHVRCPPWNAGIFGHSFIHVMFPSGRAFGLQIAELTSGESTGFGYIWDGTTLEQCKVRSVSEWNRLVPRGEPVSVVLERANGALVEITGQTANNVAVANLAARPVPADLTDPDALLTLFGDTSWTWDGETGHGTWERTKLVRGLML